MHKIPNHVALLLLIFFSQLAIGQNTSITLKEKRNSKPIAYANIVLYNMDNSLFKGLTSDINGIAKFNIDEKVKYEVSFMGYANKKGEISPGENLTIKMAVDAEILDAVVVTGLHTAKKADQSIYKIDVVNSVQLEQRGVSNLADALQNETNIRLKVDPSTGTSIEMNGMGGENVKYLIDGVPIVGRVDGNIDLSQINMDNVDHIEIVQGPMSVVYGTSALAGVINIITKQNTRNKNIIKANSYIDDKGNYNIGAYSSIIRGKNTFALSGQRNIFQGIDIDLDANTGKINTDTSLVVPGHSSRYMEFKPKLVYNTDAEYSYRNNDFSLRLKSSYMNTTLKHYNNLSPLLIARDNDFNTTRWMSSISISDKLSESVSYNIVGAYTLFSKSTDYITKNVSDTISTRFDLESLESRIDSTNHTTYNNLMSRGTFVYTPSSLSNLSIQTGWDINYDDGEGDKIAENAVMSDYAVFISSQWEAIENLSIQPGIRFIYNTSYKAPLIPSFNIQYNPIESLGIRLSYAKGFRTPSIKELYIDFQDSNHNLFGNDSLKSETTNSYNASISYKFKGENYIFKLEPSFFFNDGKDKIRMILTDEATNSATNVNIGLARNIGMNINTTFLHFNGLTLGAGYSRTGESIADSIGGEATDYLFYNNYTFNAKYNFNKLKLVIMANYKLYGETPLLMLNPLYNEEIVNDEEQYYYAYSQAYSDLEITISKMFWKNRITAVVGGKNLFDNYASETKGVLIENPTNRGTYSAANRYGPRNYGRTFFIRINLKLSN